MFMVYPDPSTLAEVTATRLLITLADAQCSRGEAAVALTGGGIGTKTLAALCSSPLRGTLDWTRLQVWWGDERYVAADDGDRNELQAREALLDHVGIPPANCHPMPAAQPGVDLADAAGRFQDTVDLLKPQFDVVLLGVGPDGHVASLFPGHAALGATSTVAAVPDSPKPPPARITFTFEAINAARRVWLIAAGAEKAEAVASALEPGSELPAARVRGTEETLWLLDREAAAQAR